MERSKSRTWFGEWWWTLDRWLLLALLLLAALGLVMLMSASPAIAHKLGLSHFHFVIRQAVFLTISVMVMLVTSFLPKRTIRRLSFLGFIVALGLLVLVQFIGMDAKGAKRWIYLAGFTLQPSELLKPLFAVFVGWVLAQGSMKAGYPSYKIAIALWLVVVALLMLQPDFGMTLTVTAIFITQLFLAGISWWWILALGMGGLCSIVTVYLSFPHVANRINLFLDPTSGDNFQSRKALEAITQGGVFGTGPGEGQVKHIIPDAHTDFIFAVIGEEFGLVVSLLIMSIFLCIVLRGFWLALQQEHVFIFLASAGIVTQFAIQAMINMGVATSILPNTGMTLPFVSYGGSSSVGVALGMGILLGLTRKEYRRF